MDLNYSNAKGKLLGLIHDFEIDMAIGSDENDFSLILPISDYGKLQAGYLIFFEDSNDGLVSHTEWGGVIDSVEVKTTDEEVVYSGRTWTGILENKVIIPDDDSDYYTVSGDANEVLLAWIEKLGLSSLFNVSTESSGITIDNYIVPGWSDGYTSLVAMLQSYNAKMTVNYSDKMVNIAVVEANDYTNDDRMDSDQTEIDITENSRPVNHLIIYTVPDEDAEETETRVITHAYMDESGVCSQTQSLFGIDEIAEANETSLDDEEEVLADAYEKLAEYYEEAYKADASFDVVKVYDIGDIVGAKDNATGIYITAPIVKKILTIDSNGMNVECQIGDDK